MMKVPFWLLVLVSFLVTFTLMEIFDVRVESVCRPTIYRHGPPLRHFDRDV